MVNTAVETNAPGFAAGVLHVFKIGDAGIVCPYFAAAPGANVEYVVKCQLDDAAMTHGYDSFVAVALKYLFHKHAQAGAKVHQAFPFFVIGVLEENGRSPRKQLSVIMNVKIP
jgi:hypothetical protein